MKIKLKNDLDYEIIDKGMLVNSIFNYPVNTTFFSTADKLEIGEIPFISHNVKPTRTEALEYYRRVCDSWKLNLSLYNEVSEILNKNSHFESIRSFYKNNDINLHCNYKSKWFCNLNANNFLVEVDLEFIEDYLNPLIWKEKIENFL